LTTPEDLPKRNFRFYELGLYAYPAIGLFHFAWIFVFAAVGVPALSIFNIGSTLAWMLGMWLHRNRKLLAGFCIVQTEIGLHALAACSMLGLAPGYHLYLLPSGAAAFLVPMAFRYRLIDAAANAAVFVLLYVVLGSNPQPDALGSAFPVSAEAIRWLGVMNIVSVFFVTSIVVYYYSRAAEIAEDELEQEYDRAETLLQNILPADVAERLKSHVGVIADRLEGVSVLFADIVNFTPYAERNPPEHVVAQLNEIFSDIDDLAQSRGLEKIKTVGDAYMVVCGAPVPNEDHARIIADFALELTSLIDRHRLVNVDGAERSLAMRIGIHCGPLVAGVIGKRKFAYDVWGDTVNTAARMESYGVPGRIHITAEMVDALGARYVVEERGEIEVHGKGRMRTFFLRGRRPARTRDLASYG